MAPHASETVGQQIALARARRGWTQQQLADEVQRTDPASTLNRAAIGKIESGVRRVSVDEALLLAATINVPPAMVLLPVGTGHHVQIGGHQVATEDAVGWFLGRHGLLGEDGWIEGYEPVRLYEDARRARTAALYAHDLLLARQDQGDDDGAAEALDQLAEALRWLGDALRSLQASRLQVPPVDGRFLQVMERLGLDTSGLRPWSSSEED